MIKKKITIEICAETDNEFEDVLNIITNQVKFGYLNGFDRNLPNYYNYDIVIIENNDESEEEIDVF